MCFSCIGRSIGRKRSSDCVIRGSSEGGQSLIGNILDVLSLKVTDL